ncbi:MAG: DNA-processing protein DprA, partial [bacterium]
TEIYDPPPALFTYGNVSLLQNTRVAIVGTRSSSQTGNEISTELARGLSQVGITVVSGLAAGIDSAAHTGALEGEGSTTAVLGAGVDVPYPARNRSLHHCVGQQGLLVSEYSPGTQPAREHFPNRNRIISGLSRAIIVVQAGERSGALITA